MCYNIENNFLGGEKMEILLYIIIILVAYSIMGLISRNINESKGYDGGFAWGFLLGIIGIIVVAVRNPNIISYNQYDDLHYSANDNSKLSMLENQSDDERTLKNGGWKCSKCRRVNASYVTTCDCGMNIRDNNAENQIKSISSENIRNNKIEKNIKINSSDSVMNELKKYKEMLDNGLISEEDYDKKKKSLLGI